ncbi:MAG: DUF262 domain-containing HNH endonuclease family protein [Pseudomonadota bacterium]
MAYETRLISIGDLFAGSAIYQMPAFQRPFSWGDDMVAQLFDDIQNAFANAAYRPGEPFFLGSIIVTRAGLTTPYNVIDGQQRLTTLSIILACLRDQLSSETKRQQLQAYLVRPETAAAGIAASPRVLLRYIERDEYRDWVMTVGGTRVLPRQANSDAALLLRNAVERVRDEIPAVDEEYLGRLISFLLSSCQLVQIVTPSLEAGFRLFQSVNTPGRSLDALDICRAEYIGPAAAAGGEGAELARLWDAIEDQIGRDEFEKYAAVVAANFAPIETRGDLRAMVAAIVRAPGQMIRFRDALKFFLSAFGALDRADLPYAAADAAPINRVVACLNAWEDEGWKPSALAWLAREPTAQETLKFFRALDALSFFVAVASLAKSPRARRWQAVTRAVEAGEALNAATSPLMVTPSERERVLKALRGDLKATMKWLKPVLRRLNAGMVEPDAAPPLPDPVTLEHVLPQNPKAGSPWLASFPDADERRKLAKRLGNFALLTPGANSRGGAKSFNDKKDVYLGFEGHQNFPLTIDIARRPRWTPEVIIERSERLSEMARRILHA